PPDATMRDALVLLAQRRGIVIVVEAAAVAGVVTTGDLTRLLERSANALAVPVSQVMTRTPQVAQMDELGSAVVHRMEKHGIIAMPVIDLAGQPVGVIH